MQSLIYSLRDDMLIFSKGTVSSLKTIDNLLDQLANITGLTINKEKSRICFSKGCPSKEELKAVIGVEEGKLPMKYLGIPLSANYLKAKNFPRLVDRCKEWIEGWMANSLSFAGRVELIKTVLLGTMQFWIQSFKLPISIIKTLKCMLGKFLWRGEMHAWAWQKLCLSKSEGGLEIRRTQDMNIAEGIKLVWRCINSNAIWAQWTDVNDLPLELEGSILYFLHLCTLPFFLDCFVKFFLMKCQGLYQPHGFSSKKYIRRTQFSGRQVHPPYTQVTGNL